MSDNTTDAVPFILRDLQQTVGALQRSIADLGAGLRDDLGRIRVELREIRERQENMVSIFGGAHRDHERRIAYVDPPPRPRRR